MTTYEQIREIEIIDKTQLNAKDYDTLYDKYIDLQVKLLNEDKFY